MANILTLRRDPSDILEQSDYFAGVPNPISSTTESSGTLRKYVPNQGALAPAQPRTPARGGAAPEVTDTSPCLVSGPACRWDWLEMIAVRIGFDSFTAGARTMPRLFEKGGPCLRLAGSWRD
nr:unnamed protein product [Digitaria exilis]